MNESERFQLLSLDDAHDAWNAMSPAAREDVLAQPGGWSTGPRGKSRLNSIGRQLAKRCWREFPELTQQTIRNLMVKMGIRPKQRAALCGSSPRPESVSPAEYMPPGRRVIVNLIGADGLTDAESAAGAESLA